MLLISSKGDVLAASSAPMEAPAAVALARSRDSVFVADAGGHAVYRFSLPDLQLVGSTATGVCIENSSSSAVPLKLSYPAGLAVSASTGRLFVSDKGNHRVVCLEESLNRLVFEFGACGQAGLEDGKLNLPGGVCILEPQCSVSMRAAQLPGGIAGVEPDPEEVVVADTNNNRLVIFCAKSGQFLRSLGGDVRAPPPGLSEEEFLAWHASQSKTGSMLRLTEPAGVCASAAGRIVVAECRSGVWHVVDRYGNPTRISFAPYPALAQKLAKAAEEAAAETQSATRRQAIRRQQEPMEWALGIAGGAGGGWGDAGRIFLVEDCENCVRVARTVRLV